jgi:hypothetical protein
MTIFDPVLAYFSVEKWLFSRVFAPAKREILDIFVRDKKSSEAVKKVLRYRQKFFFLALDSPLSP